jgi:hypothetical protein
MRLTFFKLLLPGLTLKCWLITMYLITMNSKFFLRQPFHLFDLLLFIIWIDCIKSIPLIILVFILRILLELLTLLGLICIVVTTFIAIRMKIQHIFLGFLNRLPITFIKISSKIRGLLEFINICLFLLH